MRRSLRPDTLALFPKSVAERGEKRMKYTQQEMNLTREQRKDLNEKVLYLIDSGSAEETGITSEDIYNA